MQRPMLLIAMSVVLWGLLDARGLAVERQQDQEPLDGLREGIQMVEDGDYAAAIDVLEAAAIQLEADRAAPRDMARSYFYAGVARVFIVGDDEARFAFHEAQQHDPQFRPTAAQFPRRVIRLWEEASTMEVETESLAGGESAGTLTVLTEPAGATVYVAGRPRGETPVEVAGLLAGEHRVTIVKDGYINNSRVLALAPNSAERLSIELTGAAAGALQEDSGEGGGRGGGWWKWAAIAGGGAVATYALLPKNKPPVAGLSVSPTGTGMAGATNFRFDGGRSSDPDNDSLSYSWNFGDGSSGSGVNTSHVYDSPGSYSVTLTVSDGKEQATATGSASVSRNLDGGRFVAESVVRGSSPPIDITETLTLTQNGSTLRGQYAVLLRQGAASARGSTSVTGSIDGTSNFVCPCDVRLSGSGYSFTGTVDNGANVMTGQGRLSTDAGTITGESSYERQ